MPSPLWRAVFPAVLMTACLLVPLSAQETNVALGRPVSASAATWGGQPPEHLTDGNPQNQSHPLASSGTLGFFYQIDLEATRNLGSIVLHNRSGCCPERLSNYNVTVYADSNGAPGTPNWSANIRTDGSDSGDGGSDTLTADLDPAGTLAGRFIRVTNLSNAAYNPQIAELEAFEAPLPTINFTVDHGNITRTGNPGLPNSATLTWSVTGATSVSIAPALGSVPTSGSRSVTPATTTTYTLSASNGIGTATDTVTVGVDAPTLPPVLTEFMASNGGSHTDTDGASPDWIELFNPNPFNLSLDGYYLTDDPDNPTKWRIPAVSVPAESHLVIFASGDDRTDPSSTLHTNFQLSSDGEYLALVSPDGTTVLTKFPADHPTTTTFPPQRENRSYGLSPDGSTTGYFFPATPGATNGTPFAGFVRDTAFSTDRGFYTDPVTVEITTPTEGASIRYTTDGSEPSPTRGTVYTAPLTISATTTLRALAYQDGLAPTNVDTHTYVFVADVVTQRTLSRTITQSSTYGPQLPAALTDLPAMSVVTGGRINGTSEIATSLEMIFPDGTPGFQENCGIKNYGGAFTNFDKKNFRFYFRSTYGAAKLNFPLFSGLARGNGFEPADRFDQIVLRAGSHDMVQRGFYMSNRFTDDTMLDMGQINPHGRFVHLYINGDYWGLYHLRERWNAANQASYLGGPKDAYESINGNWNVGGWSLAGPADAYDGDGSAWERIKTLTGDYQGIRPYLDVPHYIDYMLMFMFGNSEDEYRCVGPANVGSGFKWFLNDADGYLRTSAGNNTSFGSGNPPRSRGAGPWGIFAGLFREGHPDYRTLLADRIHKHYFNDGALTPARNDARLRERTDRIERAFIAESARWGYRTPSSWARERNTIFNWFRSRTNAAINDYRRAGFYPSTAAPVFSQHGGQVPAGFVLGITAPSTVYYTTDGSDPRLPGGAVNPAALTYTSTGGTTTSTLVPSGAAWRFLDDGSDQGTAWRATAFDDASWKSGDAELGYGQNVPQTGVDWGTDPTDRHLTTYFRRTFAVENPGAIVAATVQIKRDDGAVVYLNGTEVGRTSMPDGVITASTLADLASDDGRDFHPLTVPPGLFQQGTNTIAVEVHQQAGNSSDLSFDLSLEIETTDAPNDPLRINQNTWVRARTRSGNSWSALNEAFFQSADADPVAPGDIVISELNYNPDGNGEFVELLNITDHAVNLRGARFTDGIQYDFPTIDDTVLAPGQRLLLVSSLYAFQQTYGIDLPVAGIYRGSLDNGGEQLTLTAPDRVTPLADLTYDDTSPWPTGADGEGRSLVLADPLDPSNPASWRPSLTAGGTPLGTDSIPYIPGTDLLTYALSAPLTASFDPDDHLLLAYSRPIAHDVATVTIRSSLDLASFTDATSTFTLHARQQNPDNTETLTFRSTTPSESSTPKFYHLAITTK